MIAVNSREIAEKRAESRFDLGPMQKEALMTRVTDTVIRDKLVVPAAMHFWVANEGNTRLRLAYGRKDDPLWTQDSKDVESVSIHKHALSQLSEKVGLPMAFVNRLNRKDETEFWRLTLLAHNFNELFHNTTFPGDKPRFLHRVVNGELRGFLSKRFNRHLASLPMLRAFVEAYEREGALPVEASGSDIRVSLKAYLPHVFEAFPGQYICVGVEWANSDFGSGRLTISQTIWDPMRNTRVVMDESISRVHLGSIIEDSDIEMSDETMAKEVEAQASAIADSVGQQLGTELIERMLRAIKAAHEEEIPISRLRGSWKSVLLKNEMESLEELLNKSDVEDLPPPGRNLNGEPIPSKWWAASFLSHVADKCGDEDRRSDLQREAGKLLVQAKEAESGS